ncbi:hypothetical protein SSUST1_0749 [Streptococcus suis ST1]|nr:hypothetical protein SSUST1_0749 [Streptococcus suis ST1]AGW87580.1 hypothetical protein YB51_6040 [Streptococcus suis YB51]CAR46193.1 hypothetical protein SSU1049 [Streptococcus suis P1/7]
MEIGVPKQISAIRISYSESDLINYAGVGVKQSGDRLFQLNN